MKDMSGVSVSLAILGSRLSNSKLHRGYVNRRNRLNFTEVRGETPGYLQVGLVENTPCRKAKAPMPPRTRVHEHRTLGTTDSGVRRPLRFRSSLVSQSH